MGCLTLQGGAVGLLWGAEIAGVVLLKYGCGNFENVSEKCGIFVICR